MHLTSNEIIVFTDGASRGNPGPGGFGAIVIVSENNDEIYDLGSKIYELGGRAAQTTNNRMELTAAIEALEFVSKLNAKPARLNSPCQNDLVGLGSGGRLTLYADSSYVINGITRWIHGWQKNGWKTKNKKSVLNADLWRTLFALTEGRKIDWRLVGGHIGVAGNSRADEIATAFADGENPALYQGPLVGYPIPDIITLKHDVGLIRQKSASRSHSKAKAHSYVSMVNGAIQVHQTWGACEARVKGKKARYQKVLSADEERKLIAEWNKQH